MRTQSVRPPHIHKRQRTADGAFLYSTISSKILAKSFRICYNTIRYINLGIVKSKKNLSHLEHEKQENRNENKSS